MGLNVTTRDRYPLVSQDGHCNVCGFYFYRRFLWRCGHCSLVVCVPRGCASNHVRRCPPEPRRSLTNTCVGCGSWRPLGTGEPAADPNVVYAVDKVNFKDGEWVLAFGDDSNLGAIYAEPAIRAFKAITGLRDGLLGVGGDAPIVLNHVPGGQGNAFIENVAIAYGKADKGHTPRDVSVLDGHSLEGHELLYPCLSVLPMGFSYSVAEEFALARKSAKGDKSGKGDAG